MAQDRAQARDNEDGDQVVEAGAPPTDRPRRADARRNEEKLLAAARRVFTAQGTTASMDAVAKEAGVGVGTLYRHFPKRVDLAEALYRSDVDEIVAAAAKALAEPDAWQGLSTWMEAYVRYSMSKRALLNELNEAFAKDPGLRLASRERVVAALSAVLGRAQEAGAARTDLDGEDVLQLVWPMCMSATLTEPQAHRLLATVLDGLRARD